MKVSMPARSARLIPNEAKYKSIPNAVMPIDPNGTRPISTFRPESFSQSSDPVPMPIENTARSRVTTFSSRPRTLRAYGVNDVRKIEPKNHSHEIPMSELKTARSRAAIFRFCHVSVKGFQLMRRSGAADAVGGMNCDAIRPNTAIVTHAH